jgi:fructosamine-3-kinase
MSRRDVYYWKCDRPAAFHGTRNRSETDPQISQISQMLAKELQRHFNDQEVVLHASAAQGNHLAWTSEIAGKAVFIRVEDGPEKNRHLTVESLVLDRVRAVGVRTPRVLGCDTSRSRVPFAWQALERIPAPDLNHWFKAGTLEVQRIAFDIGVAVATWQDITLEGFGTLDESLRGQRASYADYFHLRLEEHLYFLKSRGFLSETGEIFDEIETHRGLLSVGRGCLVHKDLALWNILGAKDGIAAFIDFDDAISGDPVDDLSLLACFHDASFLVRALAGYQSVRPLPVECLRRFWLHLLRNMIVKAVIRIGAGYFERSDRFFLIGTGLTGADLERTTRDRLALALRGLRENSETTIL